MRHTSATVTLSVCFGLVGCANTGPQDPFLVVSGGQLAPNIALGVDTSEHQHQWVTTDNAGQHLDLAYPSGQTWGLVQFWLGMDLPEARPHEDFREFNTLQLLLDGTWFEEAAPVSLGIAGEQPADQLFVEPVRVQLPAHSADQGPTYYQLDLAQFDRGNSPSPRSRLTSPAAFLFSGGCGALVQIYEIALFKDLPSCCTPICTKDQ